MLNQFNHFIQCPIIVTSVYKFKEKKQSILDAINNSAEAYPELNTKVELNVLKSDWHNNENPDREWFQMVYPFLHDNILQSCKTIGFNSYNLLQAWFQQYTHLGSHGWHIHSGNFSGVFYVDLPQSSPVTLFCDPLSKETFFPNATEGDVVIFPSFILHKSVHNQSKETKTIISFNFDVGYPDEFYGDGINE